MSSDIAVLATTAASLGFVHTVIGPDHYLPFIALARAREWTALRTAAITLVCGVGHVLGSVLLGLVGVFFGFALGGLEWVEGLRGDLAAWLLLGFGLAYTLWGVRYALRRRPHTHWHVHQDGSRHEHEHSHLAEHAHLHEKKAGKPVTPWVLFLIFVFGPCEPLIPLLMYPAAESSWWGVGLVAVVFGVATLATMLAVVMLGYFGLSRLAFGRMERYSHALAGLALVACGAAIQMGL